MAEPPTSPRRRRRPRSSCLRRRPAKAPIRKSGLRSRRLPAGCASGLVGGTSALFSLVTRLTTGFVATRRRCWGRERSSWAGLPAMASSRAGRRPQPGPGNEYQFNLANTAVAFEAAACPSSTTAGAVMLTTPVPTAPCRFHQPAYSPGPTQPCLGQSSTTKPGTTATCSSRRIPWRCCLLRRPGPATRSPCISTRSSGPICPGRLGGRLPRNTGGGGACSGANCPLDTWDVIQLTFISAGLTASRDRGKQRHLCPAHDREDLHRPAVVARSWVRRPRAGGRLDRRQAAFQRPAGPLPVPRTRTTLAAMPGT